MDEVDSLTITNSTIDITKKVKSTVKTDEVKEVGELDSAKENQAPKEVFIEQ